MSLHQIRQPKEKDQFQKRIICMHRTFSETILACSIINPSLAFSFRFSLPSSLCGLIFLSSSSAECSLPNFGCSSFRSVHDYRLVVRLCQLARLQLFKTKRLTLYNASQTVSFTFSSVFVFPLDMVLSRENMTELKCMSTLFTVFCSFLGSCRA